jgi:hypothetical protein
MWHPILLDYSHSQGYWGPCATAGCEADNVWLEYIKDVAASNFGVQYWRLVLSTKDAACVLCNLVAVAMVTCWYLTFSDTLPYCWKLTKQNHHQGCTERDSIQTPWEPNPFSDKQNTKYTHPSFPGPLQFISYLHVYKIASNVIYIQRDSLDLLFVSWCYHSLFRLKSPYYSKNIITILWVDLIGICQEVKMFSFCFRPSTLTQHEVT